ncbi:33072_t:CDS:2, partial [Racocetra persica]
MASRLQQQEPHSSKTNYLHLNKYITFNNLTYSRTQNGLSHQNVVDPSKSHNRTNDHMNPSSRSSNFNIHSRCFIASSKFP